MADKKKTRHCAACQTPEGPTWPILTWNGLNLCFSCIEDMVHKMFMEPMGDQAAEHMVMHVKETHPWLLPQDDSDGSPVLEVETKEQSTLPTPAEMHAMLDNYVIGQDLAKRTLCVAVYNHYLRLRQPKSDDGYGVSTSSNIPIFSLRSRILWQDSSIRDIGITPSSTAL